MFWINYSYLYYYISLSSFCIPRNSEAKQSSDHHFQSSSGKQSHGSEAIIRSPLTVSPCEVKQPSLLTTTPLHCPSESIPADTCPVRKGTVPPSKAGSARGPSESTGDVSEREPAPIQSRIRPRPFRIERRRVRKGTCPHPKPDPPVALPVRPPFW